LVRVGGLDGAERNALCRPHVPRGERFQIAWTEQHPAAALTDSHVTDLAVPYLVIQSPRADSERVCGL
jgi:hypothetical protein